MEEQSNENLFVKDDELVFEDFDNDDSMENLLKIFVLKNGTKPDGSQILSFVTFIIFLFVNVGCVSFNLYKAITIETDVKNDMFGFNTNTNTKAITLFNTTTLTSKSGTENSIIIDKPTKILYVTEFSVIFIFFLISVYYYICLFCVDKNSEYYLSGAANFSRLVREFSCFSLVPLFSLSTFLSIINKISESYKLERKKYFDHVELWEGIWGVNTMDNIQKTNEVIEIRVENENTEANNIDENKDNETEKESKFKRIKHSKLFLRIVSILIFIGFILAIFILLLFTIFAFIALYIKARHVGNFITQNNSNFMYKWFNFITFIVNIASLSQDSPAIKLLTYQIRVLIRKAYSNEYYRKKQSHIKENQGKFNPDKEKPGIQTPKIIIYRKKISRSTDEKEVESHEENEIYNFGNKLLPLPLSQKNSSLLELY
ncbi:hypothetical protein H8356DRAFT_1630216 [Neocallimastix lanati (nom. inval.)]|jgi:hypothetical protein|uniref:Uncharacterized protein n=1 Tax=Neocallimastix californiae TaxID=1754190 RepID=A0A1Y2ESD3_9FUNG|nr:hypothetical protein H8356DRAFT_1630216 [Neocallimastix sp. JGI-2020a]ORY74437.1 hypothetical protein LY90DRAFT_699287 [Neocallimastix californiae]|eukprot:ORY74437.1 hypothetical protein LY90DRAFT_699287 [Neocallimastix californiae]